MITIRRKKSVKIPRRLLRDMTRVGAQAAGHHFKSNMLRIRFTKQGARLLNYAKRSGESGSGTGKGRGSFRGTYTGRKLREKGHTRPMVWSGDSERASRGARVKARTLNGTGEKVVAVANVTFTAPNLNYKNPKSKNHVHPSEEIKRVAPSERKILSRVAGGAADKHLDRNLKRRK